MAFESDLVKMPEANLTSLVGILSIEGVQRFQDGFDFL